MKSVPVLVVVVESLVVVESVVVVPPVAVEPPLPPGLVVPPVDPPLSVDVAPAEPPPLLES